MEGQGGVVVLEAVDGGRGERGEMVSGIWTAEGRVKGDWPRVE